jgi:hypothetical protein
LTINARKKGHGAVEVAEPDLGGAGVKIESAFLVHLGRRVRTRQDLDTNIGCADKDDRVLADFGPIGSEPGDIDGSDPACGGDRALRNGFAPGEQLEKQSSYLHLAPSMPRSGWGTHEYAAVLIGLDAIRELRELRISENFLPASEVKARLRFEVRELNRNRHAGKIRQKWKKA